MKVILKELKEKSLFLGQLLKQIETRQKSLKIKGNLQITKTKKRISFYQYFDSKSKTHYLNKSETPLLTDLTQKKYDKQTCTALVSVISRNVRKYRRVS